MPDLMTLLANFSSQIEPIIMMLQGIASLMGLYMVAGSLAELWGVSHDNALKYMPGKNRFSVGSAFVQLIIGAFLCAMGTLQLVGILSRTLTDDFANSRFLSYTPAGGSFEEQRLAAMAALLGIMQIVGFVAMIKGWITESSRQRPSSSRHWPGCWLAGWRCYCVEFQVVHGRSQLYSWLQYHRHVHAIRRSKFVRPIKPISSTHNCFSLVQPQSNSGA